MNEGRLEKVFLIGSISYLVIPIIVFFFGWLKGIIALLFSCVIVLFCWNIYKQLSKNIKILFTKKTRVFWLISFICICVWVYFSGIGSFSYQNGDYWVRNPIYRDLCNYNWPVIYDLSLEPDYIKALAGTSKVAFSYYYIWWLPPAFISKLFGNVEIISNIILYIWAVLGCLIVLYNLNAIIGECRYSSLLVLLFFSGMDVIGYAISMHRFSLIKHLEWWAYTTFQYSSNTTQLYWVFNQSIALWIITELLLQLKDNRYIGGLCAISIAYSPWATLGFIPIAFAGSFRKKEEIRNVFNLSNILIVLVLGISFGLFYISSSGSSGGIELTISLFKDQIILFVVGYILFLILECGVYFYLTYEDNRKDVYYFVIMIELIIFPLIRIREGNFTMRASIPALFILMVYVLRTLYNSKNERIRKLVVIALIIGAFTPMNEINRSLYNTIILNVRDNHEEIYSFGNIKTNDESYIEIARDQFFIYDYEKSLFFKYLAK